MNDTGEHGPVDFVVGDDDPPHDPHGTDGQRVADGMSPGGAERLAQPAPPRRTRLGVLAAALVLVVVVAAVIVHGRSETRPTARASTSPRPSSSPSAAASSTAPGPPAPVPGQQQVIDALPQLTRPPACPDADDGRPACYGRRQVPAAFVRSVHARFPLVRQTSAVTQLMRPGLSQSTAGLWSRAYTASGQGLTLQIYVRRGADRQPIALASLDDGAHTTVFSEQAVGRYTVEVQVAGVSGADIDQHAVSTLAGDARLVSAR